MREKREAELDRFDRAILDALASDGRISITDLAGHIGLSKSPTQARLRRLEAEGVILGYRALVDPLRLGRDHVAFVEIKLTDTREAALKAFNKAAIRIPEVEECHMLAAHFDYLLKVRCRNMRDFRRVLGEAISTLPYVAQSSTHVAMQAVKEEGQAVPDVVV
ncbi:Lrp/AsnC family transcriptional regulator [Aliiroseovarius lamellibrachiae]|uniref:Lrp/AsnC family transcriptional regulator n=1 Tax=Aliiroseovarius lamellibrachiae TaxID=1924933 RepID=UPI001BDFC986|nr:Lrp/AsnC ligand binding domain-containing protein [Aliiroseovarius lamellibrachiae]MBT2130047.1 Lrp/AsnC ligand binding domain-containing protein [Aliiroseovarius lamellibrachiae]